MGSARRETMLDRALGALYGAALGDALGMPTQTLSPGEIGKTYGEITDFVDPVPGHPVSHGLVAASITDDTEQTIILIEHLVTSPDQFDEQAWARSLIDWEASVRERGLLDLLGPSTKRALNALVGGAAPAETGRSGDTNGAAMRIAPVGIATWLEPLPQLLDQVEMTCRVTHNTAAAIAAAGAVAAAISAGVDGATVDEMCYCALAAARQGEMRGFGQDSADIAKRVELALSLADGSHEVESRQLIATEIGTDVSARESVPAAFGLFKLARGDAWTAGLLSANIGGDTDTIGAIAAGLCGAHSGLSALPQDKIATLVEVNDLSFEDHARELLDIRERRRKRQLDSALAGYAS